MSGTRPVLPPLAPLVIKAAFVKGRFASVCFAGLLSLIPLPFEAATALAMVFALATPAVSNPS